MPQTAWPRILPFAVFMAFIAVQQGVVYLGEQGIISLSADHLLLFYPLKAVSVFVLLLLFYRRYSELVFSDLRHVGNTLLSLSVGMVVFVLWVNMDWAFPLAGGDQQFDPTAVDRELFRYLLIFSRVFGAALVVPLMEELFWRSFLLRYIISTDFKAVAIGRFTWGSFVLTSILFGLEHNLIIAGIMAGIAYNLLLYKTRSLAQCVLSHAVTNFALAIYVLQTQSWRFW